MKLDVIIPCAGSANYIDETLERVVRQTRKANAIYLVDNASGHTRYRQAAEKYASDGVRYVRFERRLAMTLNWQRCLGIGKGEFCLLLNDDDLPLPDAFETGLGFFESPDTIGVLLPPIYLEPEVVNAEAERLGVIDNFRKIDELAEPARSFYLSTASVNHMSALIFRRGSVGFFPHLKWMPDQGFLFALAVQGTVKLALRSGVEIRRHAESLTVSAFAGNGRMSSEERTYLRMVIEVFAENYGLSDEDFVPIAALARPYYLKRVLQACHSWPWRQSGKRLGRQIARNKALRKFVRREPGLGGPWPGAAAFVTSVASDLRSFLREKRLDDRA